jgi:glycosyltransferase involved in cell wall biosynthesis
MPALKPDIVYVAFNRLRYTQETFRALVANTDWEGVNRLFVYDDCSTDGTWEYLLAESSRVPRRISRFLIHGRKFGSPVEIMNHYLYSGDFNPAPVWCKIDSDTMVPPGWWTPCATLMDTHPSLGVLGIEALGRRRSGPLGIEPTNSVGGIGMMRTSAFTGTMKAERIYHGFWEWQIEHPEVLKAWIVPPLKVFLLDRLPYKAWRDLATTYEQRGWQRPWKNYTFDDAHLWEWWDPMSVSN